MSEPIIKSRLLIDTRHLGDIFYDRDKNGNGYLKLSFKNKIAGLAKGTDIRDTTLPVSIPVQEPIKLELSYKFNGDVFSIKKTRGGKKPEYEFYKVENPPKTCLFFLKIKDWRLLDDVDGSKNSLVIKAPSEHNVVVVFSFLNSEGQPLSPPEYSDMIMGVVNLPEKTLNKFCIGIVPDAINNETNNIIIAFPYTK